MKINLRLFLFLIILPSHISYENSLSRALSLYQKRLQPRSQAADDKMIFEIIEPKSKQDPPQKNPHNSKRVVLAVISAIFGASYSFYQNFALGGTSLALLHTMEKETLPVQTAVCNGKPTMLEFYADWCESCREIAPAVRSLELKYKKDVNFVVLNGVKEENLDYVQKLRVDGIPHLAFLTKDAKVETALVGAVPKEILEQEIQSLIKGEKLPFDGFDAFEGRDDERSFLKSCQ